MHRTIEMGGQFVVLGTGHADSGLRNLAGGHFRQAGSLSSDDLGNAVVAVHCAGHRPCRQWCCATWQADTSEKVVRTQPYLGMQMRSI